MINNNMFFWGKFRAPIDPDLQAVLDFADANGITKPDNSLLFAINRFIIKLKNNGAYSKMDVFLLFLYNNVNLINFSRICWKRLILVDIYNCGFSPTRGFTTYQNNVNAYIDPLYNPVTNGVNYTATSAHIGGVVSFQYSSGGAVFSGQIDQNFRNLLSLANSNISRINSSGSLSAAFDYAGVGFKILNRLDSTNLIVQNRANQETRTQTQNLFENRQQTIGRMNASYGAMDFGAFTMGGALTSSQITTTRQAYIEYLNEIGLSTLANSI
jgi:hypothetical protein